MAKLVLYLPDGSVHDIPLDKERLTIGRRADNDICLPFPAVSGEHAVVVTILADSFLEDLNSTNGTLVNGKPVAKHFLRDNDLIDIGRQHLLYLTRDDTHADPVSPDVQRREARGLQNQSERVSEEHKAKTADSPGTAAAGAEKPLADAIIDPLIPDDELLADFDIGVLPGAPKAEPPPAPQPRPLVQPSTSRSSRSSSTVASRLASTWTPDDPAAQKPAREVALPQEVASPPMRRKTTVRTKVVDPRQPPEPEVATPGYRVRVLSGPNEGRELPLTRPEMAVGRVGTQVARLTDDPGGWRLTPLEGAAPLERNGTPVPAEGVLLTAGDRFRVADTELVFERP